MENSDSEEPEKKRPHLSSPRSASPPHNKPVEVAVLQYQNQRLVQQLDAQKNELHDLESKIQKCRSNQTSYDDVLVSVNLLWNQLVDDLVLLGVRAGRDKSALVALDHSGGSIPSSTADEMFLCRLLRVGEIPGSGNDGIAKFVEESLSSRRSLTMKLLKSVEDAIVADRVKTESIAQALVGKLSAEDAIIQLSRIDGMMQEEAKNMREVIEVLHSKHKDYNNLIEGYLGSQSIDQSEIKRLEDELEESMAELEESRRKLVSLQMQKDAATGVHTPAAGVANGNLSPEKPADKSKGFKELRDSIDEAKILTADRLSELQEAKDENQMLQKELEELQNEQKDEKHVHSSRQYNLVNDQLQHWNTEMERYKVLADSLQVERPFLMRREKDVNAKMESVDAARNSIETSESRVEDLEVQLQKCLFEKHDLEIKMEEAVQDSGRNDIKAEFRVMASALSKEMGMMEAQLNRWKQTAHEAISLREKSKSLKASLSEKTVEQKSLADKCAEQLVEIKSLKTVIEKMQKERRELQIVLDMYGQDDSRDILEIKESEQKARSQAEVLRSALEDHSLELRVKAANEAEAACRQRLHTAEAEIAELRAKLDASERDVLELTEAIKIKDREAEAYISEIETIGQAYEDMQTQNQHLLQQMTDRDDYNIKLVSESVKTKQAQSVLLSEKQALSKQLQQVNISVEALKLKITKFEEQMKVCLAEAMRSIEEDKRLVINLETARSELMDAEKELKWLKHAVASSEKEHEQIQKEMDEIQSDLDSERTERKKLEEELAELNNKIAEMSSESLEVAIQRLQNEIKDCKGILKCSVCSDRPKEVVIVKCYHLFCNPCIQRNLEIRHRKCPGCGTAFGQSDVRFVKI